LRYGGFPATIVARYLFNTFRIRYEKSESEQKKILNKQLIPDRRNNLFSPIWRD